MLFVDRGLGRSAYLLREILTLEPLVVDLIFFELLSHVLIGRTHPDMDG